MSGRNWPYERVYTETVNTEKVYTKAEDSEPVDVKAVNSGAWTQHAQ